MSLRSSLLVVVKEEKEGDEGHHPVEETQSLKTATSVVKGYQSFVGGPSTARKRGGGGAKGMDDNGSLSSSDSYPSTSQQQYQEHSTPVGASAVTTETAPLGVGPRRRPSSRNSTLSSSGDSFTSLTTPPQSNNNNMSNLLRRAFSITDRSSGGSVHRQQRDEYESTALSDDDDDDILEEEDGFLTAAEAARRRGDLPTTNRTIQNHNRQRGIMACCMVAVLVIAAVAAGATKRQKTPAIYYGDSSSSSSSSGSSSSGVGGGQQAAEGTCKMDPLHALRSWALREDLHHGAVASDQAVCSQLGTSILRDTGGNAVDAAVTTALCLGVANPASSGIGGGGFMLLYASPRSKDQKPLPDFHDARTTTTTQPPEGGEKVLEVVDCREIAPAAASTDMYAGMPDAASVVGGLAVPVLGELRGLELAHARYGSLRWEQVVQPVVELARKGVHVNRNLANEIQFVATATLEALSSAMPEEKLMWYQDEEFRKLFTKNDDWKHPLQEGDVYKNPKLVETLQAIMEEGADAIYKGPRAAALAAEIQKAGGIVTEEDLNQYQATLRTPVMTQASSKGGGVNGFTVVGIPPPSSGGAVILGALRFLSGYLTPMASFADTLSIHRFVEACKHVFSIRLSLSDPAYNTQTVQDAVLDLTTGDYMEQLRLTTLDNESLPLSKYGGEKWSQVDDTDGEAEGYDAKEGDRRLLLQQQQKRRRLIRPLGYLEDHGTSHFSIVDAAGNAVAMTTSVNTYFGSTVVSPSTGIVFSNTMDDFGIPSATKNHYGVMSSEANFIQPGKKPLSSMSPTMVFHKPTNDDENESNNNRNGGLGELVLVVGASGGPKIITAVLQVIINIIMLGKPLFESIQQPRVHNQLIYHDSAVTTVEFSELEAIPEESSPWSSPSPVILALSKRTQDSLAKRGHRLLNISYTGTVQAVAVDLETGHLTAGCDLRKGGSPDGY